MEQYSQEEVKKKIAELKAKNAYLLAMRKAQQEAERSVSYSIPCSQNLKMYRSSGL